MGFILKKITPQGEEKNYNIGNSYMLIHKDKCGKFKETLRVFLIGKEDEEDHKDIFAFIMCGKLKPPFPLYGKNMYQVHLNFSKKFLKIKKNI